MSIATDLLILVSFLLHINVLEFDSCFFVIRAAIHYNMGIIYIDYLGVNCCQIRLLIFFSNRFFK